MFIEADRMENNELSVETQKQPKQNKNKSMIKSESEKFSEKRCLIFFLFSVL